MLIVGLFLSVSLSTFGQEFIQQAINKYSDISIVRKGNVDTIVIYSFCEDTSSFVLTTYGNTNPNEMYFDNLVVNDFEIFEKRVYFCGYAIEGDEMKAAFGFFNLYQFPNGNIYYYVLDDFYELNKIDVYKTIELQFMEENHIVMTGAKVMVDVTFPFSAPPYCRVHETENEHEFYDDVAVTKNYVIVSSRNQENGIPVINYLEFNRPNVLGQDIFSMSVECIRVSSPVAKNPVLLEHREDDKYAAVYKNLGFQQMEMTLLEAPNSIQGGIEIFGNQDSNTVYPLEIKYNKISNVYDILARKRITPYENAKAMFMQIYHVTSDELSNISTQGNGTKYPGDNVWSIDQVPSTNGRFVASGNNVTLKLFSYKFDQWYCPESFRYPYLTGKPTGGYIGGWTISSAYKPISIKKKETRPQKMPFPVKCEKQ